MSQENVELVRAQYASFQKLGGGGGDVRSHFLRFFASDAEYWPVEEIDAIRGHDALIQYTERWLDAWESYRDQVDEIIDGGELVMGAVTVHGRGMGSGVQVAQTMFHVFEIRDLKIARLREYLDRGHALEGARLGEERSGPRRTPRLAAAFRSVEAVGIAPTSADVVSMRLRVCPSESHLGIRVGRSAGHVAGAIPS